MVMNSIMAPAYGEIKLLGGESHYVYPTSSPIEIIGLRLFANGGRNFTPISYKKKLQIDR
jgi:hypothetical protein